MEISDSTGRVEVQPGFVKYKGMGVRWWYYLIAQFAPTSSLIG